MTTRRTRTVTVETHARTSPAIATEYQSEFSVITTAPDSCDEVVDSVVPEAELETPGLPSSVAPLSVAAAVLADEVVVLEVHVVVPLFKVQVNFVVVWP
jgi:hypothetical protein